MSARDDDPFIDELNRKEPSEASIRSIMSSMHIEGFMMTEQEVRQALQGYYDADGPSKVKELVRRMNEPGADADALMEELAEGVVGLRL